MEQFLFQAYQTYSEFNKTGADNLLVYVASNNSLFVPLILFAFGFIVTLSVYYGQIKNANRTDPLAAMMTGSFMTSLLALLMTLKDGLITNTVFGITLVITLGCIIIWYISMNRE